MAMRNRTNSGFSMGFWPYVDLKFNDIFVMWHQPDFRSSFDRFNEIELNSVHCSYIGYWAPSTSIHTITCTKCFVNNFSILVMQSKQRGIKHLKWVLCFIFIRCVFFFSSSSSFHFGSFSLFDDRWFPYYTIFNWDFV